MPSLFADDATRLSLYKELSLYGMSTPLKLNQANLSKPFVYHRKHGVFYVKNGCHALAMTQLLCWDLGVRNKNEIDTESLFGKKNDEVDIGFLADFFIENTKGTCFLSSNSEFIFCGKSGHLDFRELTFFKGVSYLL